MSAERVPEYVTADQSGWELSVTLLDAKDDGSLDEGRGLGSTVAFAANPASPIQATRYAGDGDFGGLRCPPAEGWCEGSGLLCRQTPYETMRMASEN